MDVKKTTDKLADQAEKLQKLASSTDIALTEMRIQFETLAEMQKDERIEIQKMHVIEKENLLKQFAEDRESHYTRIIYALILTLVILLGSIIGGVVYFFANYDILNAEQIIDIGGNGNPIINDGIHYSKTN